MRLYVNGIGLLGPGLGGWSECRSVLAGHGAYCETAPPEPSASLLPPNERRRSSDVVRWAVHVAQEAIEQAETDPKTLATVFACSGGEMGILNQLCTTLAMSERVVSPTLFHQSVHNAAAGYWSIATRCQQSSTALSCYDWSFGSGLLEAAAYVCSEEKTVLLVAYDLPPPSPLYAALPFVAGFAAAFVLAPTPALHTFAQLDLTLSNDLSERATRMEDARLEVLRTGNPAARSLPLMTAIARSCTAPVFLEYLEDQHLVINVAPCPA
jgi:hypothetical protein